MIQLVHHLIARIQLVLGVQNPAMIHSSSSSDSEDEGLDDGAGLQLLLQDNVIMDVILIVIRILITVF